MVIRAIALDILNAACEEPQLVLCIINVERFFGVREVKQNVRYINTSVFMWLSFWIFGFVLMTAGWLIDVLLESYGEIPSKILYKTGAIIVATPVIYLLWRVAALIFTNRLNIVIFLRDGFELIQYFKGALMSL